MAAGQTVFLLLSAVAVIVGEEVRKCADKKYGENSVVCVCNSTYCDDVGVIKPPATGKCFHFESNMAGLRLESQLCKLSISKGDDKTDVLKVTVDPLQTYQTILGFGGSITDSVGISIASLSVQTQKKLIRQYFAPEGIGYTFIRLPLGGSDFSTRYYTYDDDVNDTTLSHFSLTKDDYKYKIPFIKQAISLSAMPVKLLTSIWEIPKWMKEPRFFMDFMGFSKLQDNYYQLLADYIIRFLDSYQDEGLEFWGLSAYNEPFSSFFLFWVPSTMGWTSKEQTCFLNNYLIPTLTAKGYDSLKLFLLEDQRIWINTLLNEMENYPEALKRVDGLALHWYLDNLYSPDIFVDLRKRFPNWIIIYTEASVLPLPFMKAVRLGNWRNAESYVTDIMENLNHEVAAWIDWNIALDTNGGPSYIENYLDAPIIVNASADEFYKQPMFYAMAHFSKFVPPDSVRVNINLANQAFLQGTAFRTPDNTITTVLANGNDGPLNVQLYVKKVGWMYITLSARSISTVVCNSNTKEQG